MKDPIAELPPEIAKQIDPVWRKNETEYWAVRDSLLRKYADQWIGFADGRVVVSGASPVAVLHAAEDAARSPFVVCVGREEEPCRMRRSTFNYDPGYPGEPLPILSVEFRPVSGMPGVSLTGVIADTRRRCQRFAVGGLPAIAAWCGAWQTGMDGRNGWRQRRHSGFSDMGPDGRARVSLPVASRLHWQRADTRPRRVESAGSAISRAVIGADC